MGETIFKPKYPAKMYWGILIITVLECFILWQIFSGKDTSLGIVFVAAFFGLLLALMPYAIIRRIVFGRDAFSIERFLWRKKMIVYADVMDIGTTIIKTRNGKLSIQSMTNSEELRNIFAGLIEQGKINRYQIENQLLSQELISQRALRPALVIAFVLWGITFLVWPYEHSFFRDLSFLAFFIPVYFVVNWFLKNRADNQ
jgi:hypothetical protein